MPLSGLYASGLDGYSSGLPAEPQKVNHAHIYLQDVNMGDDFEVNPVTLSLESFPLPKSSVGRTELHCLTNTRKFATSIQVPDVPIVLKDWISHVVANALLTWHYQVHDPYTGRTAYPAEYKGNGAIVLYDSQGYESAQANLYGIWPESYDAGEIQMSGDGQVMVQVVFCVDKVIWVPWDAIGIMPGPWPQLFDSSSLGGGV